MNDIQNRLSDPFHAGDIEWRVQSSGVKDGKPWAMVIPYVTSRAVQTRLDDVLGIFGWKNEFKEGPQGGVLCGISIKHNKEWITKWDGAENTTIEAVKGGLSDAEKRAAVQLGVGRYLYNLDAVFAICSVGREYTNNITFQEKKWNTNTKKKENVGDPIFGSWDIPQLPAWAVPSEYLKLKQVRKIEQLMTESGTDQDYFFEWLGINSVSRIKKDKYDIVVEKLTAKLHESHVEYALNIAASIALIEESTNVRMLDAIYLDAERKIGSDEQTLVYITKAYQSQKEVLKNETA